MSSETTLTAEIVKSSEIQPVTESHAVNAMHSVKFRVPGDAVAKAVAGLPEEQRAAIKWFAGYCRARNLSPDDCSKLLKKENGSNYAWDSIYQNLTGRRSTEGMSVPLFCKAIVQFREQIEGVSRLGDSGYIHTRLGEIITERCQKALAHGKILFLFGESHIGKSEALKHYQRTHNHGETIYVEVPTGGHLGTFLDELKLACGIPGQDRISETRRRIIDSFDRRTLLIVDEGHNGLRETRSTRGAPIFTFLKELYNRTGCGIVVSMTNEGRDLFKSGPDSKALAQLWKRRIAPLQLPDVPLADDLDKFATAYGLAPATEEPVTISVETVANGKSGRKNFTDNPLRLQNHVCKTEGLGVWLLLLQEAANTAKTLKRSITWGAVLKAYCADQAEAEIIF